MEGLVCRLWHSRGKGRVYILRIWGRRGASWLLLLRAVFVETLLLLLLLLWRRHAVHWRLRAFGVLCVWFEAGMVVHAGALETGVLRREGGARDAGMRI